MYFPFFNLGCETVKYLVHPEWKKLKEMPVLKSWNWNISPLHFTHSGWMWNSSAVIKQSIVVLQQFYSVKYLVQKRLLYHMFWLQPSSNLQNETEWWRVRTEVFCSSRAACFFTQPMCCGPWQNRAKQSYFFSNEVWEWRTPTIRIECYYFHCPIWLQNKACL